MHPGARGISESRRVGGQGCIITVFNREPQGAAVIIAPDKEEVFIGIVVPQVDGSIEQEPVSGPGSGPVFITVVPEADGTLVARNEIGIDGVDTVVRVIRYLPVTAGARIAGTGGIAGRASERSGTLKSQA